MYLYKGDYYSLEELKDNNALVLPFVLPECVPIWYLFVVRSKQRDLLQKKLHENDIQTLIHYPIPPHKQKAYIEMNNLSLPISEKIHNEVISLPMGPHLQENDLAYIIDCIKR